LPNVVQGLGEWQWLIGFDYLGESLARNVVHCDKRLSGFFKKVDYSDDVGMLTPRQALGFGNKLLLKLRRFWVLAQTFVQGFEYDGLV